MKIAIYAGSEEALSEAGYALSFGGNQIAEADGSAPLAAEIALFDQERYDAFVIMDGSADDREVAKAVNGHKGDMRVIYVSGEGRRCPSVFYTVLVKGGCTDIVANLGGEEYDWAGDLVRLVCKPKTPLIECKKYCEFPCESAKAEPAPPAEGAGADKAASAKEEPAEAAEPEKGNAPAEAAETEPAAPAVREDPSRSAADAAAPEGAKEGPAAQKTDGPTAKKAAPSKHIDATVDAERQHRLEEMKRERRRAAINDLIPTYEAVMAGSAAPDNIKDAMRKNAKKIVVSQSSPKNGSTHLTITIARTLSHLGFKVGCVLPSKSYEEIIRMTKPPKGFTETSLYFTFQGIDFYQGNMSNVVVVGKYDFVVTDMDVPVWFSDALVSNDAAERAKAKAMFEDYRSSDLRIMATRVDSVGNWPFGQDIYKSRLVEVVLEDGRTVQEMMTTSDILEDKSYKDQAKALKSSVVAVHGATDALLKALNDKVWQVKESRTPLFPVPYIPAPLWSQEFCVEIFELLYGAGTLLPKANKYVREARAALDAIDGIGEEAPDAPDGSAQKRKMFGFGRKG